MQRFLSFKKQLITKIIMILAPVFLFFFLLVGFITESLLEKQIINNADEIIDALLTHESEQVNKHFESIKNLGLRSAEVIKDWITNEDGISAQEFNRKFKIHNNALRTDLSAYPDSAVSGVFLSNISRLTAETRKIISVTEHKFDEYAKATKPFVFNMYLITKQQLIRIYEKDWALEIEADHDFNLDIFYNIATPQNNPQRLPKWTKPYYDSIWERWMTSLITPIYIENEFIGVVGHDVILDEIYDKIVKQKYFETGYGFIFDSNKNLIIHPRYLAKLKEKAGMGDLLSTSELGDFELKNIISDGIIKFSEGETKIKNVYKFNGKTYVVYISKLEMLNWFYSIDIPIDELSEAISGFGVYFFIGVIILSAILFVTVTWVMWILVVKPIKILQGATEDIVAGYLNKVVDVNTRDEIGKLSVSFNEMITQINQKIHEIKTAEEKYRSIFDNAVEGIYQSTVEGKFISANQSAAKILGYDSPQDLIETVKDISTDSYVNKNMRASFIDLFANADVVRDLELRAYKKDKSIIWLLFNVRCQRDLNGNIEYFEGFFTDITETRKAQHALIEAKDRAELSERVKSEFLAQVSHEIRTPISAILSFSNLIKDELQEKVDPDLQDGFMAINRAGKRIIRTIDLILNMSEVQSGSYEYKGKPIDIYEDIILFTFGEYKQLAREKNLKLTITHNTKKTGIVADEYTVSQIIQNLVDNAIKYTLEGNVEIIVDRNEYDNLTVAVKDTGIGISKEYLPLLFSAFTQEEQGYTRKFEGNGLGLALIKKYCELNNAEITVESEKNVGTIFTVTFKKT